MSKVIKISVIIPTYNRAHILPNVLEALLAQGFPQDEFEVLIVDDGSTDSTLDYLARLGPPVRAFSQQHAGSARARNLAAEHARGDILAFTDDDCQPAPDWLAVIQTSMEKHACAVGLLGHTYSKYPARTFIHSVFKYGEPVVTCNFAVSRGGFEQVGGFDTHFEIYFEDEDLGLRLEKAGYPILYEPQMRVEHPSRYQSFRGFLRMRRAFQYLYYMSRKHPDADHWHRHRGVIRQIVKRSILFLTPALAGFLWSPLWALLVAVFVAHCGVDAWRAWRQRGELAEFGYRLRAQDFRAFTLLNWAVPFIDAWQISKGFLRDRGKVQPWTPPRPRVSRD